MYFSYVLIVGCKRFSLRSLDRVEIDMSSKVNMVMGSNGVGKSSILRMGFSVMPGDKNDFYPGGYIIRRVHHNGHHYELKSTFDGKPEHYFRRDGIELNTIGTVTVQKELVREHFGWDQGLQDVISGNLPFTKMTTAERQHWITRLSSTSFSFVLNLYSESRKRARKAAAVVERAQEKLTAEMAKMASQEDLDYLLKRSDELRRELDILLTESNASAAGRTELMKDQIDLELATLESEFVAHSKLHIRPPQGMWWENMGQLERDIGQTKGHLGALEGTLDQLGEDFQYFEGQMAKLRTIEGMDEGYVRQRIAELEAEIATCFAKMTTGLAIEEIAHSPRAVDAVRAFMEIIHRLKPEDAETYNQEKVTQARQEYEQLSEKLNRTNQTLANIDGRLHHINNCEAINCPNCNHSFKQGVEQSEKEKLEANQAKGLQIKRSTGERTTELRSYLDEVMQYQRDLSHLDSWRHAHAFLKGFWEVIADAGGIAQGYNLKDVCEQYLRDVRLTAKIIDLREKLAPVKESLTTLEKVSSDGVTIRERYYFLKSRIEETNEEINVANKRLSVMEKYHADLVGYDATSQLLIERYADMQKHVERLVEAIRQDEIRGVVKAHQTNLSIAETALTESEIQQGIIKDISKEIDLMSLRQKAWKAIENELCPKNGLISESIGVFINTLIDRMNAVIARIWGYNLALKHCDLENGELDYLFPLYAVKKENEVPDVKFGSDSQVSIVNLAFRLVVYKFMKLHHYPLYLDEMGRDFDPVHRHNLIFAIKDLIDDDTYSQVFIISHYIDGQASFPDAQFIVMDRDHLDANLPQLEGVS